MSVSVNWGDFDKNIAQMIVDVDKTIRIKAGKTAGKQIAEKLSNNTPKSEKAGDIHLADDVTVGSVNEQGEVEVGYSKQTAWRVHFSNFGTVHQRGQHFIEKTVEESSEDAMRTYMSELKRGLNL